MKQINLACGFVVQLKDDAMNNMELVDVLEEMNGDNDLFAISRICKLVLGKDQRKQLYDHLRAEDGRVPVEAVAAAVKEIFNSSGSQGKNC